MEPPHRQLLSRIELTSILNERHLKIPSIEALSYEELLRIYKTFAVPLEQREVKHRSIDPRMPQLEQYYMPPPKRVYAQDVLAQTLILDNHIKTQHDPHLLQQTKYLKLSYNTISIAATKRHSGGNSNEDVTPAKRKLISWP